MEIKKFNINNRYLFMFTEHEIFYFDMQMNFQTIDPSLILQELNLKISEDEKAIKIKDLRVSPNPNFVAIVQDLNL